MLAYRNIFFHRLEAQENPLAFVYRTSTNHNWICLRTNLQFQPTAGRPELNASQFWDHLNVLHNGLPSRHLWVCHRRLLLLLRCHNECVWAAPVDLVLTVCQPPSVIGRRRRYLMPCQPCHHRETACHCHRESAYHCSRLLRLPDQSVLQHEDQHRLSGTRSSPVLTHLLNRIKAVRSWFIYYLCEGRCVFVTVCLFVCKNCWTDFHKIRWKDGTSATEETIRLGR